MKQSIETDIRLDTLKQLVYELTKALGAGCEVILHDLRNPDHSCVAISGNVTGRKVGAPLTDLGLKLLMKGEHASNLMGYLSSSPDGKKLKSSTIIIRNSRGKPIAFICINFDLSTLSILRDFVNSYFPMDFPVGDIALNDGENETFPKDGQEILISVVAGVLKKFEKPISIMKKEDKLRIIEMMKDVGVFTIKNSHYYVASVLNISRYTVYNYLNEIKHRATYLSP